MRRLLLRRLMLLSALSVAFLLSLKFCGPSRLSAYFAIAGARGGFPPTLGEPVAARGISEHLPADAAFDGTPPGERRDEAIMAPAPFTFDPRSYDLTEANNDGEEGKGPSYCSPLPDQPLAPKGEVPPPQPRKCLVPSPDGRSASFALVDRSDFQNWIQLGEAFVMFPRPPKLMKGAGWFGRRFNNLKQIYMALVSARACGMAVVLPRATVDRSPGMFNCVDYRGSRPIAGVKGKGNISFPQFDRDEFCDFSVLEDIDKNETSLANAVSQYWHSWRDWHGWRDCKVFPFQVPDPYFSGVAMEAKRTTLAYGGVTSGSYKCQPCSEGGDGVNANGILNNDTIVAYVRGGDIFKGEGKVAGHKGQPPLDFYVQAIRHSNATRVVVVSMDRRNPVVQALEGYDWTGDGGAPIKVITRVGDEFDVSLRLIFCTRKLILGNTSMAILALFGPNAGLIYIGRMSIRNSAGNAGADPLSLKTRSPTSSPQNGTDTAIAPLVKGNTVTRGTWVMPNERQTGPLLATVPGLRVYGYASGMEYSPYNHKWTMSGHQMRQMVEYKGGALVRLK